MSSRSEEKQQKLLKQIRADPANKKCMDCSAPFPQYIVMDFGTWVCTTCSGIHREFSHKVKSPTMGTFKDEEIKFLQTKGNEVASQLYRARWRPEEFPIPNAGDTSKIREFIRLTFVEKKWMNRDGATSALNKNDTIKTQSTPKTNPPKANPPKESLLDLLDFDTPTPQQNNSQPFGQPQVQGTQISFAQQNFGFTPQNNVGTSFNQPAFNPFAVADTFGPSTTSFAANPPQPAVFNPFDFSGGFSNQAQSVPQPQPVNNVPQPVFNIVPNQFGTALPFPLSAPFNSNSMVSPVSSIPFSQNQPSFTPVAQVPFQQFTFNPAPSNLFTPSKPSQPVLQPPSQPSQPALQPSYQPLNPFDLFDPLAPAPKSQPPAVNSITNGVEDLSLFALPTANPQNDVFDFPSLKNTTPTSNPTITPIQPPPPRQALIRPSPIQNVNKNPQPEKVSTKIPKENEPVCPICGEEFSNDISNRAINDHVDECLKSGDMISTGSVRNSTGSKYERKKSASNIDNSQDSNWEHWFDMSKMEWYFPQIDRDEAEKILFRCAYDAFLVRKSSVRDSLALSIYNHKKQTVTHTLIEKRNGGYAFQEHSTIYPTMVDLVQRSPECAGLRPPPKQVD